MAKSANVTKVEAGGSGDNVVKDGYIKTVEKVWIDTYSAGTATIATGTLITVAKVPSGKKVTGVDVYIPSGIANTLATIQIGLKDSDTDATTADTLFLAATAIGTNRVLRANQGMPKATTANEDKTEAEVFLKTGTQAITTTNATITTVVRYT